VNVPVQTEDINCGSNADPNNDQTTKSRKRNGRGKHYLPVIKTLLLTREAWDEIENEEAYALPGFTNLPKVLYCRDWEHLPLASTSDSFIVKDCQLSLGPTHATVRELDIDGKPTKVSIRRGQCEGVKVCCGEGCNRQYIVSRSQKLNRRPEHGKKKIGLEESGPCPVNVVYVTPKNIADKQRWIVTLSLDGSGHNHGKSSPHNIPTSVREDIKAAVIADPSKTTADLQKGNFITLRILIKIIIMFWMMMITMTMTIMMMMMVRKRFFFSGNGMSYMPSDVSVVATNISKVRQARRSATEASGRLLGLAKSLSPILNFEKEIRQRVYNDAKGGNSQELASLLNPYPMPDLPYVLMGDEKYAIFQNPYQTEIMGQSEFLNIDITFTQNDLFPYLLNIVAFDYLVLEWVAVARVLLNRQTSQAHATAFRHIFQGTTSRCLAFDNGKKLSGITVDFSDAEAKGLRDVLGRDLAD